MFLYSPAWNCARLRSLIWQHISRYLLHSLEAIEDKSPIVQKVLRFIESVEASHNVKLQLELSSLLEIRLVNQFGVPVTNEFIKKVQTGVEIVSKPPAQSSLMPADIYEHLQLSPLQARIPDSNKIGSALVDRLLGGQFPASKDVSVGKCHIIFCASDTPDAAVILTLLFSYLSMNS